MKPMRQKEIDWKCKFFDNHIQINDKWLRKSRFEDLTALEALRHHYIQMLSPINTKWESIFNYMKTLPKLISKYEYAYMKGSYNGNLYLYSYHDDGMSENRIFNPPLYTDEWAITIPVEDLPLYINDDRVEGRVKSIIMERLTNNIEIPTRDDLVTLYHTVCNRSNKLYQMIAIINSILISYISNKHRDLCYRGRKWEKEYFFNLTLNNRLYVFHFLNHEFKLVQTPESTTISEYEPKEVSHYFFDKNASHYYLNN